MDESSNFTTQLEKAEMVGRRTTLLHLNGCEYGPVEAAPAAGQAGFYQRKPTGILFFGKDRDPFAFAVTNPKQGLFFVSCAKHGDAIRYLFSTSSADERRLGIEGLGPAREADLVRSLVEQLANTMEN